MSMSRPRVKGSSQGRRWSQRERAGRLDRRRVARTAPEVYVHTSRCLLRNFRHKGDLAFITGEGLRCGSSRAEARVSYETYLVQKEEKNGEERNEAA